MMNEHSSFVEGALPAACPGMSYNLFENSDRHGSRGNNEVDFLSNMRRRPPRDLGSYHFKTTIKNAIAFQ